MECKMVIVMAACGGGKEEAQRLLAESGGYVRKALQVMGSFTDEICIGPGE